MDLLQALRRYLPGRCIECGRPVWGLEGRCRPCRADRMEELLQQLERGDTMDTCDGARDVLAALIESESGTVRVASREAGECVRRTAADPSAFQVERDDGTWIVRYVGRQDVCGCREYETDTPALYRSRETTHCPACGARVRVLDVDGSTVRLAAHRTPEN